MEAAVKEASSLLGYSSLKEEQLCSIKAFMDGRDVFLSSCPLALASQLVSHVSHLLSIYTKEGVLIKNQ